MKKFIIVLLVICLCLVAFPTFSACDEGAVGVTEQEWNDAKEEANFDNVTFQLNATFITPEEYGSSVNFIKLDGDKVAIKEGIDGEYEVMEEADIVDSVKSVYINTVLSITEDFDNFSYDDENGCYKASGDIVYTVIVEGVNVTITAKNAVVTLDANSKIAKVLCNMTQTYTIDSETTSMVLDAEFTFSGYGTTVV